MLTIGTYIHHILSCNGAIAALLSNVISLTVKAVRSKQAYFAERLYKSMKVWRI